MNRIIFISLLFFFFSCYKEEVIEIDSSIYEKQLVVYSLITPQTDSIYVSLSHTNGDLSQLYDTVTILPKGEVVISESENQIVLKQLSAKPAIYGCSQKEFLIEKGKTYTLTATIKGYPQVTSTTQIPEKFCRWENAKTPTYGIMYMPGGLGAANYVYYFEAEWKPSKEERVENYFSFRTGGTRYILEFNYLASHGYRGFHYNVVDSVLFQDKVYQLFNPEDIGTVIFKPEYYCFSTSIVEDFAVEYLNTTGNVIEASCQPSGRVYQNLTFYLFTVDEHFAAYKELEEQYEKANGNLYYPFSKYDGILPSYTNIVGGYGLFGSYGLDSVSYTFDNKVNFFEPVQQKPIHE